MGREVRLVQIDRAVQAMVRLSACRTAGVNRRDYSPAVRLVHPYQASTRQDASSEAAQQSHAR
jgi:hypothetical protein